MKKRAENLVHLKELAHGAGIAFLFGIFGYFIMFFFKLIAARYYGPSDFGLFTLSETILSLCVVIAGLGISAGILRYMPLYKTLGRKRLFRGYVSFVFNFQLFSSLLLFFLIFIFSDNITTFFNFPAEFSLFLKVISFAIPLRVIGGALRYIFLAEKKVFYHFLSYNVIERVILFLGVLLIFLFKLSIFHLILLFLASIVIAFAFDFYTYKTKIKLVEAVKKRHKTREWLYFSLPLLFTGIFAFLISWTDNLVIGKFLEPQSLGIYSIAYSFAMFLGFFKNSFSGIFMPLISESYAKKKHEKISFLFKKSSAWIFGLTFPIFLIMFLYSKQILTVFYGQSFSAGYLPLMIISIGFIVNISTGLNNQILILHKKTKFMFYANSFIAAFNIIFNIALIPLLGIIGAAISSSVSMALQNLIFLSLAKRYEKLEFDWAYYLKFILAGIPSILIAAGLFRIGLNVMIALILSLIVYGTLYLLLLLIFKTFTKEDFQIILAVEKRLGLDLKLLKRIVMKFY